MKQWIVKVGSHSELWIYIVRAETAQEAKDRIETDFDAHSLGVMVIGEYIEHESGVTEIY